MAIRAVQQFQIRTVIGTEKQARATLQAMRDAGYDGIELCGFLIKKMPFWVRVLMLLAGMPIGRGGNLDWRRLIAESGLKVVGIHEDLGSILKNSPNILAEAKAFGTNYIVVTGMFRFDFSDRQAVLKLAEQLNQAGKLLAEDGIHLLYHNHNCEFRKVEPGKTAYQLLVEKTDPQYVNFEFDSYWPAEAGCDVPGLMRFLGKRMMLYHINDRGSRVTGATGSILKSDSMELEHGNMPLKELIEIAKKNGVEAIILESHKNWVDHSPVRSFQVSAEFLKTQV
jgi:sugar phosphate isomerase/epimerase